MSGLTKPWPTWFVVLISPFAMFALFLFILFICAYDFVAAIRSGKKVRRDI